MLYKDYPTCRAIIPGVYAEGFSCPNLADAALMCMNWKLEEVESLDKRLVSTSTSTLSIILKLIKYLQPLTEIKKQLLRWSKNTFKETNCVTNELSYQKRA